MQGAETVPAPIFLMIVDFLADMECGVQPFGRRWTLMPTRQAESRLSFRPIGGVRGRMESEETLRWPTNLDRHAIEQPCPGTHHRREERWTSSCVPLRHRRQTCRRDREKSLAALDWLQAQPEQRAFTLQLQMVALNLKNLK